MKSTRVRLMARLLAHGYQPAVVNRIVAACDEVKRLRRHGLDPCIGVMLAKMLANEVRP